MIKVKEQWDLLKVMLCKKQQVAVYCPYSNNPGIKERGSR